MHIHLDALGGISGNMFIGALLDTFPQWVEELPKQLSLAGFGDLVALQTKAHNDGVLTGSFFLVTEKQKNNKISTEHEHRPYALIRETLTASELSPLVKQHALSIFHVLADAEAQVHGTTIDEVSFHEVGAWDSIADVVCAAYLIDRVSEQESSCSWSVSSLPLGNGLVQTAHGALPVPAPAVTLLLKHFNFYRDHINGERITPTGAAILKYLLPNGSANGSANADQTLPLNYQLQQTGYGFGSHRFPGISNVLRVLVFSNSDAQAAVWAEQQIVQINFEIDDQTGEDLAQALSILRATEGVLDVCQFPVYGKKGRIASSVQLLAEREKTEAVVTACFLQTSTLGLRKQNTARVILSREESTFENHGTTIAVKTVLRPDGERTNKAAMDDIATITSTQQQRQKLRAELDRAIKTEDK